MITGWTGATHWLTGPAAVDTALHHAPLGTRPVVVYDAGAAATPPGARLLARVRAALPGPPVAELAVRRTASATELSAYNAEWRERDATGVVAVGGGCALDIALLAALPPAVLRTARLDRGRAGLVTLTGYATAGLPVVAIPTTLGTGAEVSAAACCERDGDGKVLVIGDALRPAYAAVDAAATEGLPVRLVREALVEILARILVPFCARPVGAAPVVALVDELSLASLRHLATVAGTAVAGTAVAGTAVADVPAGAPLGADVRLAIAAVSAHSHAGWCNVGRPANASPVWPVATEVTSVTGLTKAQANGYLLPAWAAAVLAGDDRWGDAARLRTACAALSAGDPGGGDPGGGDLGGGLGGGDLARGLAALVERWIGPAPLTLSRDLAEVVGARAARRWGAGLPVLGKFRAEEIADLVSAALGKCAVNATRSAAVS